MYKATGAAKVWQRVYERDKILGVWASIMQSPEQIVQDHVCQCVYIASRQCHLLHMYIHSLSQKYGKWVIKIVMNSKNVSMYCPPSSSLECKLQLVDVDLDTSDWLLPCATTLILLNLVILVA